MKVRIFSALTMQEAMNKVKAALGRDAIILHTRKFRKGGIGGFLGREMIEVMAAADNPNPDNEVDLNFQDNIISESNIGEENCLQEDFINKSYIVDFSSKLSKSEVDYNSLKEDGNDNLRSEMAGMKQMLEVLLSKNELRKSNPIYEYLLQKDILPDYANEIVNKLPENMVNFNLYSDDIKHFLASQLNEHIRYGSGIDLLDFECKKVALVGSTGVGKTTTLAKLAARFALECGLSVAFITSDTYRIAAVEQLKTYANILNIPLEVVYSPDEMKAAIDKHSDKHLILIDTAGRSQYNTEQISELEQLLKIDSSVETHLVLSCTTKYQDAVDVVKRFSDCSSGNIIFTKIDEAKNIGNIFNIMRTFSNLGISYVTNGQNVPDDIQVASTCNLTDIFLRD